ncbi:hypothetical protein [Mesorhizobium sp. M1273]|uniref:hypothetical protein n=1 Tax=Mesorhizobium sp. M1273 TaxID=2957075 RepID=UPI0033395402
MATWPSRPLNRGRLFLCLRLGLVDIAADVIEADDLHAELAMIDENLCRAELSATDRAVWTARRKAIYIELHPETAQGSAQALGMNKAVGNVTENFSATSFAKDTAEKTGQTDRIVRMHAERGEKVIQEAIDLIPWHQARHWNLSRQAEEASSE